MSGDPRITVVLATRDRREQVLRTLPRLLALPERPPVVVVDDASTDGTSDAVRRHHPDATVLRSDTNLGAAARNLGVRQATTAYVAFADDDSWYAPGGLTIAADVLDAHPQVAVVAADVRVEPAGMPDPVNQAMATSPLRPPELPGPEVLGFVACGAVVRREAFLAVGGFDARLLVGGEEELLALDLRSQGWRSVHVPAVLAHHEPADAGHRPGRSRRQVRNELWVACLRRPPAVVARLFRRRLGTAVRDTTVRAGVVDAVRGLPAVLPDRRRLPADVERDKRRLEASTD
jgi:GT2 family glycosyltransferase